MKKRKGVRASKAVANKQKISAAMAASAASSVSDSAQASTDAEEGSAQNSGGGLTLAEVEVEKLDTDVGSDQGAKGVVRPEPSAANPLPAALGGDSSSSDGAEEPGTEVTTHWMMQRSGTRVVATLRTLHF